MKPLDLNILFFVWLGFFLLVNIAVVAVIIYSAKRKKQLPDCAGAVVIPAFVAISLASFIFGSGFNTMPYSELALILSGSLFLMLWEYFAPKNVKNRRIKYVFIAVIMLESLMFMDVSGGFGGYGLHAAVVLGSAVLGWVALMYSFNKMKAESAVVISESSFIAFGVLLSVLFLALLGKPSLLSLGLVAAALGVAIAGFKNWGKTAIWPSFSDSALTPVTLVLGWLLVKLVASGLWVAALVLPMFFLTELVWLLCKKYALKIKNPMPMILSAIQGGAIVRGIVRAMFRNNLVLLMIALLAVSGSHGTYLLILSLVFAIYQMFRFKSWGQKQPSLRELTKGIFTEFKAGYKEQKHFYSSAFKNFKEGKTSLSQAFLKAGKEVAKKEQAAAGKEAKAAKPVKAVSENKAKPPAKKAVAPKKPTIKSKAAAEKPVAKKAVSKKVKK